MCTNRRQLPHKLDHLTTDDEHRITGLAFARFTARGVVYRYIELCKMRTKLKGEEGGWGECQMRCAFPISGCALLVNIYVSRMVGRQILLDCRRRGRVKLSKLPPAYLILSARETENDTNIHRTIYKPNQQSDFEHQTLSE